MLIQLSYLCGVASFAGVLKQSPIIGILIMLPFYLFFIALTIRSIIKGKFYISIAILLYLSIIISVFISSPEWFDFNVDRLLYVLPFYLLLSFFIYPSDKDYLLEPFFKGARLGIIANLIFSLAVSIAWYGFHFDLATTVLFDILKIDPLGQKFIHLFSYGGIDMIRPSGFSWDPMFAGTFTVMGYILFKNDDRKFFVVLSIVVLILSGSRAGMFAFIGVVFYEAFIIQKRLTVKKVLLIIFIIIIISLFVYMSIARDMEATGNIRRIAYFLLAPILFIEHSSFIELFFGGGSYSSGNFLLDLAYASGGNSALLMSIITDMHDDIGWAIESDIISILLGRGLIGFFIYFYVFFKVIKNAKNEYKLIAISFVLLSVNYSYEFSVVNQFLLLFFVGGYSLVIAKKSSDIVLLSNINSIKGKSNVS